MSGLSLSGVFLSVASFSQSVDGSASGNKSNPASSLSGSGLPIIAQPVSPEKASNLEIIKRELTGCYKVDDVVLQSALDAKLSNKQIIELVKNALSYRCSDSEKVFDAMPAAFVAAQKANLSPDQIFNLFNSIIKESWHYARPIFEALTPALEAAQKANYAPDQIYDLFSRIIIRTSHIVYGEVPFKSYTAGAFIAFKVLMQLKISPIQAYDLFFELHDLENTLPALQSTLEAAQKVNLTPDQIYYILSRIVGRYQVGAMEVQLFKALASALEAAQKVNLPPDQIFSLFHEIIMNIGIENNNAADENFIQSVISALEAYSFPDQNNEHFNESVYEDVVFYQETRKYDLKLMKMLRALPSALETAKKEKDLSTKRILELTDQELKKTERRSKRIKQ